MDVQGEQLRAWRLRRSAPPFWRSGPYCSSSMRRQCAVWAVVGWSACLGRQQASSSSRTAQSSCRCRAVSAEGQAVAAAGCRSALRECKDRGDWQQALSLLAELKKLRADYDGESFDLAIASCEMQNQWGRAMELSECLERAPAQALRQAVEHRSAGSRSPGGICLKALQVGSHVGSTPNDPLFGLLQLDDSAILVEPVPVLFQELVRNYGNRYPGNKFWFVNKAVSNHIGTATLHVPAEAPEHPEWVTQLGSLQAGHVEAHANEYNVKGLTSIDIKVETTTLNELIRERRIDHITVLHTDAEGHDFEILMDLDMSLLKPELILFEHRHMDGFLQSRSRYEQLLEHFLANGYKRVGKFREDTLLELRP